MISKLTVRVIARLWMAIGKPPSIGVDRTTAKIHAKLVQVNSEATLQLHKRSQDIQNIVKDNNTCIKDLKRSNHKLVRSNGVLARSNRDLARSNGDLARSLEKLKDQNRKFAKEVERMRLYYYSLCR